MFEFFLLWLEFNFFGNKIGRVFIYVVILFWLFFCVIGVLRRKIGMEWYFFCGLKLFGGGVIKILMFKFEMVFVFLLIGKFRVEVLGFIGLIFRFNVGLLFENIKDCFGNSFEFCWWLDRIVSVEEYCEWFVLVLIFIGVGL